MLSRPGRDPLRHVSPEERCTCPACDAARLEWLSMLSDRQRDALVALDPAVPRHPQDLRARDGVQWRTLSSLCEGVPNRRPALARLIDLKQPLAHSPYFTFVILAQHGSDLAAATTRARLPLTRGTDGGKVACRASVALQSQTAGDAHDA